jgi:hypothetical protein
MWNVNYTREKENVNDVSDIRFQNVYLPARPLAVAGVTLMLVAKVHSTHKEPS